MKINRKVFYTALLLPLLCVIGPVGERPAMAQQAQPFFDHAEDAPLELQAEKVIIELLAKPVTVQLKDASVKQMAEALEKAAKIPIRVDDSVSKETRISIEAHRVPVSLVLETVARDAKLLIARELDADKKSYRIVLTLPSSLKVNGTSQNIGEDVFSPWSSDWRIPPSAYGHAVLGMYAGLDALHQSQNAINMAQAELGQLQAGAAFPLVMDDVMPGRGISITSLGENTLVTSEPGVNEKGEAGVWLTVYKLEKDQLKPQASVFHVYRGAPRGSRPVVAPARADTTRPAAAPVTVPAPAETPRPTATPRP